MATAPQPNPFKPTAGMNPPQLIGRDSVINEFIEGLQNGPGAPDRLMRVSGVRGVGKTVLLNVLGDVAAEHGFTVVNVAANAGFCDRILHALKKGRQLKPLELAPSIMGFGLGTAEFKAEDLLLGDAMLEAAEKGGLLVTLDEIQDAPIEEMRQLGNEIQLLIRQAANVAFVFAGLPSAVDDIVAEKTLTFLQRAKPIELVALESYEVGESIKETIRRSGKEIKPAEAALLTGAAAGYPFMIQLVGYYAWQSAARRGSSEVDSTDAERGIADARKNFDAMVIRPALQRIPATQLEYLVAMARCEGMPAQSGEVARLMNKGTKEVSSYRARLIAQGLVMKRGYGKIDFAIPYMREYLQANLDDFE